MLSFRFKRFCQASAFGLKPPDYWKYGGCLIRRVPLKGSEKTVK